MKKLSLIAAATMLVASPLAFSVDDSAGGVINFDGAITDTTCTINGGNNASMSIALSPITVVEAGQQPAAVIDKNKKAFSLTFSNCSTTGNGSTFVMSFSSANNISTDGKYLANTSVDENSAEARNVGFALTKDGQSATLHNLNTPFTPEPVGDAADKNYIAEFYAHYYKTNSAPATPGALSSNVIYTVSYN